MEASLYVTSLLATTTTGLVRSSGFQHLHSPPVIEERPCYGRGKAETEYADAYADAGHGVDGKCGGVVM